MEEDHPIIEAEAPPHLPEDTSSSGKGEPEPDPAPEAEPPFDFSPLLEAERAATQSLREQLTAAAVSYRLALLASAPDVPPELVSGETPSEIDASLDAARGIVAAVRARMDTAGETPALPAPVVPAGAPVRSEPDLSALSAIEKIKYALGR